MEYDNNRRDSYFIFIYSIYLIIRVFEFTSISIPRDILGICRLIIALLIIGGVIKFDKVTIKWCITLGVLFLGAIIVSKNAGNINLIDLIVLVFGATYVNFNSIVKAFRNVSVILVILITLASLIGILPNNVFVRDGVTRYSFGFFYPTDYVAYIAYIVIADTYIAVREKKELWLRNIIYIIIAIVTFKFCNTRLGSGTIILVIFMGLYMKRKQLRGFNRYEKIFLSYSYIIFAVASLALVQLYIVAPYNNFLSSLDTLLSFRLSFSKMGVLLYGYKPFGQFIKMQVGEQTLGLNGNYFYIDSSFMYIVLVYGVITLVVLCFFYTKFLRREIARGNVLLPIAICMTGINSLVGQQLLNVVYDPFILVFLANIPIEDNFSYMRRRQEIETRNN